MKKIAILVVLLTIYPSASAAAAETQRLPNVVVTAGRIEEKASSVTQAMTLIPSEDIRKNQHADLGGLLRQYGIQVDSYAPNSGLGQTTIRGMRNGLFDSELQGGVLFLVDGRRSGTGLVSLIPMVNVERIEILRGPAAVQYGTSAMGGVINIITRRGAEKTTAMAEFGAGSFETLRTQGEVAGRIKNFDYSLGASFLNSGDYKDGSGARYDNTSVGRKVAYNANLGYNFASEHRIGLSALGVDMDALDDPGSRSYPSPEAYTDRYNYSFDALYEGGLKDYGLSWHTRWFMGRGHYGYNDPASAWFSFTRNDFQGAQGQISFTKSILTLTGGLDWSKYESWNNFDNEATSKNLGTFLLGKLSFLDELIILSGGVRYDDFKLEAEGQDNDRDRTTPSFGIALNPLSWLTLRGNYGESYVMPSGLQLVGYSAGFYTYVGDPNLKPEKGKGWDAGFDLHYNSIKITGTYFQNDYEDKIATENRLGTYYYYNMDKAKMRGIEASASLDIGELLEWDFELRPYANLTRMLKYEDDNGKKMNYVNKWDIAYGMGFNHPALGLGVDLRFVYYGGQNIDNFSTWPATESTLGGRTTADLYITKTILNDDKLGTFSVKAELRNIFDKEYYLVHDYPMPGRSFWLGLRYDY